MAGSLTYVMGQTKGNSNWFMMHQYVYRKVKAHK